MSNTNQRHQPLIKPQFQDDKPWVSTTPLRPLTRKQQVFADFLIKNPKASATQAAKQAYGKVDKPVTELSARNIASENLTKPNILLELAKHSGTAEMTVIEVMGYSKKYGKDEHFSKEQGAAYANVALHAANSLLDRLHGKATTTIESTTKVVTLNIDLTGSVTDTNL